MKDYTKWNWDTILELLQGPLLNPKRLDEVLKSTKFVKRLLSFFRPSKRFFSTIQVSKAASNKFVRVGCALMRTLIGSGEGLSLRARHSRPPFCVQFFHSGVKYLVENKLILQISEALAHLDPVCNMYCLKV